MKWLLTTRGLHIDAVHPTEAGCPDFVNVCLHQPGRCTPLDVRTGSGRVRRDRSELVEVRVVVADTHLDPPFVATRLRKTVNFLASFRSMRILGGNTGAVAGFAALFFSTRYAAAWCRGVGCRGILLTPAGMPLAPAPPEFRREADPPAPPAPPLALRWNWAGPPPEGDKWMSCR